MTISQTAWFKEETDHAYKLAIEYRYIIGGKDILKNFADRLTRSRGTNAANMILKKANQKAKYKAY